MFKVYIKTLVFTIALVFGASCYAADLYTEGKDYVRLPLSIRDKEDIKQLIISDPNKVQILYFFNYGCHGCDVLNGSFAAWVKQHVKGPDSKIKVYYLPVSFNPQWRMLAKLYYVAETLDPSGNIHEKIFIAVHKQGLKLWQESVMQEFFVKQGYTVQDFNKAFKSFAAFQKAKRADEISLAYDITVTPDIVVNGPVYSYKVELAKVGNSIPRLLAVLNYLVERETKLLVQNPQ